MIASLEAGDLKGKRIGSQWRITKAAIADFLQVVSIRRDRTAGRRGTDRTGRLRTSEVQLSRLRR